MAQPAKGCLNKGVLAKGMSGEKDTSRGDIASGGGRTPDGPGTSELQSSGSGTMGQGPDMMEMPSSVGWLWLHSHLYIRKALPQKHTRAIT